MKSSAVMKNVIGYRDYSYQESLIEEVLSLLWSEGKVVLAACPGAGKTHMALEIVQRFFKRKPKAKVLILTHGQVLLRDQWSEVVRGKTDFKTHGVIRSGAEAASAFRKHSVVLSLPQTIRDAAIGKIDLLIVDEAHHRYLRGEIQELLKDLQPEYQLLLTGTPSHFVGSDEFKLVGITIEELLPRGVLTDPVIEIVRTDYQYGLQDYDRSTMRLKSRNLSKAETIETLDRLLPQIARKLISRHRAESEKFRWDGDLSSWKDVSKRLRKTMFICNSQRQARDIARYFNRHGVPAVLSINSLGTGQEELATFTQDESVPILIVVNRGILGFNFDELFNVIDLSGSLNVNRIFQAVCRIVRPSAVEPEQRKLFIKGTNAEMSFLTYFVMSYAVALSTKEHYYSYSSKLEKREIPVVSEFIAAMEDARESRLAGRPVPDLPPLLTFSDLQSVKGTSAIAHTNFQSVISRVYLRPEPWTKERALGFARLCKSRKEFEDRFGDAYGFMCRKHLLPELDAIFGEKVRWTRKSVLAAAKSCKSIADFRKQAPGAYNFVKRNMSAGELDAVLAASTNSSYANSDARLVALLREPDIEITREGKVFRAGSELRQQRQKGSLCFVDRRQYFSLARALYTKFHGPIPSGKQICRRDSKKPLTADNIMPITARERSRRINLEIPRSRQSGNAKITQEIADQIRAEHSAGMNYAELVKKHGVSKSTVSYIIAGRTWAKL